MIEQAATPTIRVPDSLVELDQFIVWQYEQRDGGKPTKVPYQGKAPEGLTRNDLRELFGRHRSSEEIGTALRILGEHALVEFEKETTGGRPVERWFASSEEVRKARKARKGEGK